MENENKKTNKKVINIKFNIMAIICISIFVFGLVGKTLQNDTFYTIKLGEFILNNGIDMMEHFAWHEGLIYTYPHWLYDIAIYLIYNAFGFTGIYISSVVLGIILGWSVYYMTSKISKNNLISFFVTLLIMYLGRTYITARAQLVTFILFVWTMYFIESFLDTKKIRYAISLIIIPIAIANIHSAVFPFYFVLYLPYIGEWLIALIVENSDALTKLFLKVDKIRINKILKKDKRTEKEEEQLNLYIKRVDINEKRIEERKNSKKTQDSTKVIINKRNNVKWLVLIMILCAFTGLITPIGDTPYTYLLHTMKGNTTGNISEHLPLTLYNNKEGMALIVIYLVLLIIPKVKIRLSDLFLLGGLTFLTFMSRRQMSMLLFIGIISLVNMIDYLLKVYSNKEVFDEIKYYITTVIGQILTYAIIIFVTICLYWQFKDTKILNNKSYPVDACDYIVENLDIKNMKIFNDYNYGSYLMLRGIPVFIDSRADVYDPQFNGLEDDIFQDYIKTSALNCHYEETFEHYGITHVMSYANSKISLYLSKDSNYKEVYKDKSFVIFERITD